MTASFCIDDLPDNNKIIVGQQLLYIKRTFLHPDFDNVTIYYDIAIIETNEVIQFSNTVMPICLPAKPSKDENLRKNLTVDIVGWSFEEEKIKETIEEDEPEYEFHDYEFEINDNSFQSDLQHVRLKVFGKEKCNQNIDNVGNKIPEMMKSTLTCAGTDVRFFYRFTVVWTVNDFSKKTLLFKGACIVFLYNVQLF